MIARPRLWSNIQQRKVKLITVIAPAGCGKSAFLSDWARNSGLRACWYSLHISDNDLISFLNYMIDSIQNLFPEFGQSLQKMLNTSQPSIEALLVLFLQQLSALEEDFYLILDDYHFIENRQIHEKLAYLLQYLPDNLTLIISSRSSLPFPLTKLRLANDWIEIGTSDLALTMEETIQFLKMQTSSMNVEQMKAVYRQTEGWAAGIQLIMLFRQQAEIGSQAFLSRASNPHIHTYLFEEVFHGLDEEVREFLLSTACLDEWNESLCHAVSEKPNNWRVLDRLIRSNLFIIALDQERTTFRYHHLFSEFLRNYMAAQQPDELLTCHARASNWYESQQQYAEALEHATAAGNVERICALLAKLAPSMLKQGQAEQLIERIRSVDLQLVRSVPEVLIYYCWALVLRRQIEEARGIIHDLEEQISRQLDPDGRHSLIPELSLLHSHFCSLQHDFEGMMAYRMRITDYLPYESEMIKSVEFNPGHASLLRSALGNFGDYNATGTLVTRMMAYMANTEQAKQEVQVERPVWGFICGLIGECFTERHEHAQSEAYLLEAMQIGQETGMLGIFLPAVFTFLQLKTFKDPMYDPEPMLQELAVSIRENDVPYWQLPLEAFQIYLDLRQGCMDHVEDWLNRSKLSTDGAITLQREYEYLVLCRVKIALGQLPQAVSLIDRLSIIAANERLHGALIDLNLIKSVALLKQKRPLEAREILLGALQMGKEKGCFMTFVYEGEEILPILAQLLQSELEPSLLEYIRSIDEHIQIYSRKMASPLKDFDVRQLLTNREYELLTLMAEGLTNQDIADHLNLSLGSVKVYSHRIYSKLQVSNRTQAILLI
ncbi:LuxR C-terminal-related transcriptional regulator [Paenibacillus sp. HB172176]|uniref:LuxR C-terminal-related transcriptional regulator n=1 Tax=Paenibacillus sp. HB172176 TaxID=2493690 RepID=UPI00143BA18C|nr:LuxR C-terminal-related transcriptional regulator [Paenibacillus sp. HB172176]